MSSGFCRKCKQACFGLRHIATGGTLGNPTRYRWLCCVCGDTGSLATCNKCVKRDAEHRAVIQREIRELEQEERGLHRRTGEMR